MACLGNRRGEGDDGGTSGCASLEAVAGPHSRLGLADDTWGVVGVCVLDHATIRRLVKY